MKNLEIKLDTKQIARRKLQSNLFATLLISLAILVIIPLFLIMFHIFKEGFTAMQPGFLTSVPKPVGEVGGGIANALVGSILLIIIASLIAVPIGILTGLYLSEHKNSKIAEVVGLSIEVLQGIPSIVIGLIVYMWVVKPTGHFSALSGGIALAIMMIPIIVRTTEETIKLIPKSLQEASLALGAPYYHTMLQVIIPASINGIITGVLVSVSRIAGETAPLLFTSFGNPFMNYNVLKPIAALPHIIFTYAISPYEDWHKLAWGASIVLILFILGLNFTARFVTSKMNMNK